MTKPKRLAAIGALGALLAACTHVATEPGRKFTAPSEALGGASYSLPMLQYDLSVTRTLVACPAAKMFDDLAYVDPTLTFQIEAAAKGRYTKGESYAIDYRQLSSWTKISSFSLETHPNGTLKAFNASADDQSGDILKDVTKTAILVSSLASGPASAAASTALLGDASTKVTKNGKPELTPEAKDLKTLIAGSLEMTKVIVCQPHAEEMVSDRFDNREASKRVTEAMAANTKKIAGYTTLASLKSLDLEGRKDLNTLSKAQVELAAKSAELDEALGTLVGPLSVKETAFWPRDFTQSEGSFPLQANAEAKLTKLLAGPHRVPVINNAKFAASLGALTRERRLELRKAFPKVLSAYVDKYGAVAEPAEVNSACQGSDVTVSGCLKASLVVASALRATETGLKSCPKPADPKKPECLTELAYTADKKGVSSGKLLATSKVYRARDPDFDKGIFVRESAEGLLVVCKSATCPPGAPSLVTVEATYAPQLGQLRFLPFENGLFEANELSVLMAEDGRLQKVEYKSTKAALQRATAAAADIASQLRTEQIRRDDEKKKAEADARAAVTAARTEAGALRDKEVADLQAEIDVLTKKAALLKLQNPEAPTPDQYAAINEEITRNNKELALLQSRLAVHNAIKAIQEAGLPLQ
jgi:hypothetical protein